MQIDEFVKVDNYDASVGLTFEPKWGGTHYRFIVADNADYSPDYLTHVRSAANGYMSTPFGGDVEVSVRVG